jgi:PAC2 family
VFAVGIIHSPYRRWARGYAFPMRDPAGLYELSADVLEVPRGLHLIAGLTGFADAGGTVTQFGEYLIDTLETTVIATFDVDELLDYRARRPTIFFDQDHLTDYTPSTLNLYLAKDELGAPFLLLSGFEPDFQWERFTAAVLQLIDRFEVSTTTWVHAIPMPVPHTRPIGVTVSGNRTELIEGMSVWKPRTQAPANALHLLEYRLQELGHPTAGFVLLIPHYLADTEYPAAAVTALESVSAATGLIFPTDRLREEGRDFVGKIDGQVEGNAELAKLVGTLEERHDSYMEENPVRSPLTDTDGELPTADEIAAELQNFLASRRPGDEAAPKG